MYSGIYGDISGRDIELSYFYINQFLTPKDKPPEQFWKISLHQRRQLIEARKTATAESLFRAWEHIAPEELEGFKAFLNEREFAFTDDTVMTIATMDALLGNVSKPPFKDAYHHWGRKYPDVGYGGAFQKWLTSDNPMPYQSFGNGSAMRVAPIGLVAQNDTHCHHLAYLSAIPSHDHPEGIRGAKAIALAVNLAYKARKNRYADGSLEDVLLERLQHEFYYGLKQPLIEIKDTYTFDSSCQGSVPQSIRCAIESEDVLSAIKNAITLGGDCDTMAMMAGCIAEAYYDFVPKQIIATVEQKLPAEMLEVLRQFNKQFKYRFSEID